MTRWFQLKPVAFGNAIVRVVRAGDGRPDHKRRFRNRLLRVGREPINSETRTFALQTGTTSPVNGDPVPPPPGGTTAAMSDAQGPGSHVLSQSFTVTAPVLAAMLRFDVFVGNRATAFFSPNTLDFSTPTLNQQARVDILLGGAPAFSVLPADVLLNAFQTSPGDPLVSGYTHHTVDVTALINSHLGTPLTLRFAEADNVFTLQLGVDNVDIDVGAVPEPSSWLLAFWALLAMGLVRRRLAH